VPHDLVMEAGDTFGRPQGLTTVYRVVPSGVMLGFMERHLFASSTSQPHLGTVTAGAAGVHFSSSIQAKITILCRVAISVAIYFQRKVAKAARPSLKVSKCR